MHTHTHVHRFSPASNEVTNNVMKLREYVAAEASADPVLQHMVLAEVNANQHTHTDSAYEALQWLGFGMHFPRVPKGATSA